MKPDSHKYKDILEAIDPNGQENTSKLPANLQRCHLLARLIKTRRTPTWPATLSAELPAKCVTDELVDCYLRTSEAVHRILHIPTFRREYEELWVSPTKPHMAFLVQLKLVLAIGAATYDEEFSMQASAIQWVYEALTWLGEPDFKRRASLQHLQSQILLLIARETAGVAVDSVWISAGTLVRMAMYMGLHRDPLHLPKRTVLAAEMRRRLWNTVLEVMLQSSMDSGGAPLIALNDFDTTSPGNFDDDQLLAEDPIPKQEDDYTQVSISKALRRTFPLRLEIAKFLNDVSSRGTYEETLELDAGLRESYKTIRESLQSYDLRPGASTFETRFVEFVIHRYIVALHIPFLHPAFQETPYAFSKKAGTEVSLRIWYSISPSTFTIAKHSRGAMASSGRNDMTRLATNGSGFFRTVVWQAAFVVATELKAQMQEEDETLGPVLLRTDLLAVLEDAKQWCLNCLKSGETGIKAYMLICLISAQVKGFVQGIERTKFPELLAKTAEEASETCLPILEEKAAWDQPGGPTDGLEQMVSATPNGPFEDYDFNVSQQLPQNIVL
jgi:hypothetical protein